MSHARWLRGGLAALTLTLSLAPALAVHAETKPAAPAARAPAAPASKVDLNAASEAQLVEIPHVGPATAKRILEYRKQVGQIKSVDELLNVKGIGEKTLEMIRPYVTVAGDPKPSRT